MNRYWFNYKLMRAFDNTYLDSLAKAWLLCRGYKVKLHCALL
ncbi:hypothetical protein LCGC14_1602750 [marine sediment metagenome]|uniref:Uncharacterized protein n=1 Tax=marine sediment metagenome TaxID=412755 RepID=A0A0F9IB47_9ZZZZ